MNALILILWPVSCVASILAGAWLYHSIRILSVRPMYKAYQPQEAKQVEKRLALKADAEARKMQQAYLDGLQLTRDDYLREAGGVPMSGDGKVK